MLALYMLDIVPKSERACLTFRRDCAAEYGKGNNGFIDDLSVGKLYESMIALKCCQNFFTPNGRIDAGMK